MTALQIAAAIIALALIVCLLWRRQRRSPRKWIFTGHTYEDFPLGLRRPTNVDTPQNRKRYPKLAVISLEFTRRRPDGLPEPEYNETLHELDLAIVTLFDSPPAGVPILVETFGGFRHYYFCVAPEVDLEAIIRPVAQSYPAEKLSWEFRATPGWDFLRGYAERYASTISPPIDFSEKVEGKRQPHLTFPDDENGEVLRQMQEAGDDLDIPRNIDFAFAFKTQSDAERFAAAVSSADFHAEASDYPERQMWQTVVTHFMLPTHAAITELEARLSKMAAEYGGEPDGWDSIAQA